VNDRPANGGERTGDRSWRERRDAAARLLTRIAADGLAPSAEAVLEILAGDPKWEVRKEVADRLLDLPEDHMARLAARLQADDNHFVATAAARALERHRKGLKLQFRRRRGILEVQDQYACIERLHGAPAAEKARRMAERLYDVTVGAAVHEMRGLITPMVDWVDGIAAGLTAGDFDQAHLAKLMPRMRARLGTVQQVLEDMREFSRTTPPERSPESLPRLVAEAVDLARDWFAATGTDLAPVTIETDSDTPITVEVARHQVLVALRNVIKNAVESLAEGPHRLSSGRVTVRTRREDGFAVVTVTDTGMGLTEDELAEIRRYVPGKTSKKSHGTGFGLPIAFRRLRDHGGSLEIESVPDEGTTVTVVLPLEARAEEECG